MSPLRRQLPDRYSSRHDAHVEEQNSTVGGFEQTALYWCTPPCRHRGRDRRAHWLLENNRIERARFAIHYMYSHGNQVIGNVADSSSVGIALMYSKGIQVLANRVRAGHTRHSAAQPLPQSCLSAPSATLHPAAAGLLAYDAILGERESGMFDLHLSLGVSRWTFLAGKWIGLYACLLIAVAPGMLLEGRAFLAAGGDAGTFAALLLYCALLASAITSTGLLISSCSLNRGTVVSLAVGSWIVLVVLLDLVVVGMLAATAGDCRR